MANVLNEEKKQQVLALGRLGWSLRRIQQATRIRRETASAYLKTVGIAVRPPSGWGRRAPKPANEVAAKGFLFESRVTEVCFFEVGSGEIEPQFGVFPPPLIPLIDPLLEDFEMFRVRHCRVTSLASGMLRMIFEGHTLCDRPPRVNG